ncbi:MAG: hypothetical protein IJP31_03635 [Lachnospiraceae bacterium]|nr:hypothetical protein [Lachnospiraceae bacterium]
MKKKTGQVILVLLIFAFLLGCGKKAEEEVKKEPETVGEILLADFETYKEENPDSSAQETADHILSNSILQFSGATMAVEEGLLTGFNNAQITGFEEGVMFAPMIGTIPFVGYVFTLAEGVDADSFVKTLTDNADPRWNICTEADETITGKSGNSVFFVMCPMSFEETQ